MKKQRGVMPAGTLQEHAGSLTLSPVELEQLTGKTTRGQKVADSQAIELAHLGIPFLQRSDKTLVVFRRCVDAGAEAPKREPRLMLP